MTHFPSLYVLQRDRRLSDADVSALWLCPSSDCRKTVKRKAYAVHQSEAPDLIHVESGWHGIGSGRYCYRQRATTAVVVNSVTPVFHGWWCNGLRQLRFQRLRRQMQFSDLFRAVGGV